MTALPRKALLACRIATIGHGITGDRSGQSNGGDIGWEYLHVAIDDHSRLAQTQLLPTERKEDATVFLKSSLAWFSSHSVVVERVMTDNGSGYKGRLSAAACAQHKVVHKRTRPYTPKTNGKAERFIQSSIREWPYAQPFETYAQRQAAMHPWLYDHNTARPHAALVGNPRSPDSPGTTSLAAAASGLPEPRSKAHRHRLSS